MTIALIHQPYVGGGIGVYRRWPNLLPSWINAAPVELLVQGGDMGQPLLHDWPAIGDYLIIAAPLWTSPRPSAATTVHRYPRSRKQGRGP